MERLIGTTSRRRAARARHTCEITLPVVQLLEARRLLSVSAHDLVGSFAAGNTYNYKDIGSGHFNDVVIVGPTTFAGRDVTETDTFFGATSPVAHTMPVKSYSAFDATGQYVAYGTIVTDASGNATSTVTYTAGNVLLPAQLNAGQTYTFTWA